VSIPHPDEVAHGVVDVKAGVATALGKGKCVSVTIWNRTGGDLGVGGCNLDTDEHLADGSSYTLFCRDLSLLYVFSRKACHVRYTFTR
jgi:hypothetical protein